MRAWLEAIYKRFRRGLRGPALALTYPSTCFGLMSPEKGELIAEDDHLCHDLCLLPVLVRLGENALWHLIVIWQCLFEIYFTIKLAEKFVLVAHHFPTEEVALEAL